MLTRKPISTQPFYWGPTFVHIQPHQFHGYEKEKSNEKKNKVYISDKALHYYFFYPIYTSFRVKRITFLRSYNSLRNRFI